MRSTETTTTLFYLLPFSFSSPSFNICTSSLGWIRFDNDVDLCLLLEEYHCGTCKMILQLINCFNNLIGWLITHSQDAPQSNFAVLVSACNYATLR